MLLLSFSILLLSPLLRARVRARVHDIVRVGTSIGRRSAESESTSASAL